MANPLLTEIGDRRGSASFWLLHSQCLIDFPESFLNKDKLPSYPIPVALIGKLAVNKSCQGMAIGQVLMRDAFLRILDIAQNMAI